VEQFSGITIGEQLLTGVVEEKGTAVAGDPLVRSVEDELVRLSGKSEDDQLQSMAQQALRNFRERKELYAK
jgi:hypothetical protein